MVFVCRGDITVPVWFCVGDLCTVVWRMRRYREAAERVGELLKEK